MIKFLAIYLALFKVYFPAAVVLGVVYIAWKREQKKRARAAAEQRMQRKKEHEREVEAAGEAVMCERWARSINEWNKGHNTENALLAGAARIDQMRYAK